MRVEEGFQQAPFPEEHPYTSDPVLPSLLRRLLPENLRLKIESDLIRLGGYLVSEIRPLAPFVLPATLTQYNQWGQRIDDLRTSEGWRKLKESGIKDGYISIAYQRNEFREHSRTFSFAKIMLMTGDFHVIMCPLGMTDGAARIIELFGTDEMKREIFPRLISRDPTQSYISGQWMTERLGGSDVSQTETTAVPTSRLPQDLGKPYILNGFKWFSSAAEGNIAVALARTGGPSSGARGLSLFLVPVRLPNSPWNTPLANGVKMHRLKDKFGTHGVPTAELSLNDTRAWLVGPLNDGVKAISSMLNLSRIHSAIHSIGKTLLQDIPLHVANLAAVNLLYRALVHQTFGAVRLLGNSECGVATKEEEERLRLLTPTVKAFAALRATGAMEECMASLGGMGYMEEVGIGRLIRDAMVEKIWEGTVDVLALDLMRGAKEDGVVLNFVHWALGVVSTGVSNNAFRGMQSTIGSLGSAIQRLPEIFKQAAHTPLLPRLVLNYSAIVASGVFLLEHAVWSAAHDEKSHSVDVEALRRWVDEGDLRAAGEGITRVGHEWERRARMDRELVFEGTKGKAKL